MAPASAVPNPNICTIIDGLQDIVHDRFIRPVKVMSPIIIGIRAVAKLRPTLDDKTIFKLILFAASWGVTSETTLKLHGPNPV